ncbi:MAG: tetratricopeptide repeat protein [Elusimicrobiota bacterium]|nr:tetratricopeptide repeat protein [Elusimicrobiota bacterium]
MRGRWLALASALFALALIAGARMRRLHEPRFPPLSELKAGPFAFQDAMLAAAGYRAPAADLAWIHLLQYAAGSLPEYADHPGHPYEHLATLSLRVTRLDPSFHRAVLFAAGILGWFHGIERPDEAAKLLHEGMRRTPEQPMYAIYLAALAYKKEGDTDRMIALLESSFDRPETPSTMKSILANLRQSRGEHREALVLWARILESDRDRSEHARARLKIAELRGLLAKPPAKKP